MAILLILYSSLSLSFVVEDMELCEAARYFNQQKWAAEGVKAEARCMRTMDI